MWVRFTAIVRALTEKTTTDLKGNPVRTAEFDLIDNETESPDLFHRNGYYCKNMTKLG
jgi:hypothetical protein